METQAEGLVEGKENSRRDSREPPLLPREVGDATRTWEQPLQYHNFARGQSNTLEELALLITGQKDKQLVDSPIR